MLLNDYQVDAMKTARCPYLGHALVYPALGLAGETGEILENVKKLMRDPPASDEDDLCRRTKRLYEYGDVLWYLSYMARMDGFTLQQVAEANLNKLAARMAAGTIESASRPPEEG